MSERLFLSQSTSMDSLKLSCKMTRQKSIIDEPLTIIYPMGTYILLHFTLYTFFRVLICTLQAIMCCTIGSSKAHLSLLHRNSNE